MNELVKQDVALDKYSDETMLATIRDTVAKGANPAQFRMFIEVCRSTGLNPFLREVWFVPGVGIMAGRDGYLRVANEHPQFNGMKTTIERDSAGKPVKAICEIWRKDREHSIYCEAYYNEYKKSSGIWAQYPSAMIGKVAEVLALKRSFSINGVVTEEEIGEPEPTRAEKVEFAKALGEKKVAALKAWKPREEVENLGVTDDDARYLIQERGSIQTEQIPDAELTDSPMVAQLEASLEQSNPGKFKALKGFKDLKAEIVKVTGDDKLYYAALGSVGWEKSNQIPTAQMREVYKSIAAKFTAWKVAQND